MTTEMHRIFDVKGDKVDRIKHTIRPEVVYTYSPYVKQEKLPDYVAAINEQNAFSYALTNTLTAKLREKDGTFSYREFMRLKLFQVYDIHESRRDQVGDADNKRPFSDIGVEFDFLPFSYLNFSARNIYNVYDNVWTQTNYDLTLTDWRGDTAILGYRYTQNTLEEINLALKAVVTSFLDVTYVLRRNRLDQKNVDNTFGLRYHQQCWSIDLSYSNTDTDQRYMLGFSLYGLGRVGVDQGSSRNTSN
jgi:LPS-assembly protein